MQLSSYKFNYARPDVAIDGTGTEPSPTGKTCKLLTIQNVNHDAGRVGTGRWAGVVTGVLGLGAWDEQTAGPSLFLGNDADASPLGVVYDMGALVPVDEWWWLGRLHDHTGEVDVTSTLDVQLRVTQDLRLGHCSVDTDSPL